MWKFIIRLTLGSFENGRNMYLTRSMDDVNGEHRNKLFFFNTYLAYEALAI
jgi:hypothetical protein